jgi:hypothetical protein
MLIEFYGPSDNNLKPIINDFLQNENKFYKLLRNDSKKEDLNEINGKIRSKS